MRTYCTVFTVLLVGSLSGCNAGTPVVTAAETAPKTEVQHFKLYGNPDKGALLVDSETGKVWKYDGTALTLVKYHGEDPTTLTVIRDPKTGQISGIR